MRNCRGVLLPALVLLLTVAGSARAQAVFDETHATQSVPRGTDSITASFTFRNKGFSPITVTSIKSSCGCTTAKPSKKTYAPGEDGTIETVMKIKQPKGVQTKTVTVYTDSPASPKTVLTISATIQQPILLEPAYVTWHLNETVTPKTSELKVAWATPVQIADHSQSNDAFTVKLDTVADGQEYVLTASPKATDTQTRTVVSVKTVDPADVYLITLAVIPEYKKPLFSVLPYWAWGAIGVLLIVVVVFAAMSRLKQRPAPAIGGAESTPEDADQQ